MAGASYSIHVDTHGLAERFAAFTDREAKAALRAGVTKAGKKGQDLARVGAPKRTGAGAAGIRSTTRSSGGTAVALIRPTGPHAHIMVWQDQGTGPRHKRSNGQYTGKIRALHFFEQAAAVLDVYAPVVLEAEIAAAIAKSGLG